MAWELPHLEEYKNDLQQPAFLNASAIPAAASTAMERAVVPEPDSKVNEEFWTKVNKMVAGSVFVSSLYFWVFRISLYNGFL